MFVPLALNDPAGEWRVIVRELLNNTEDAATFTVSGVGECGITAGTLRRAVYFGRDLDNIFRFFRVNGHVTIVTGAGDYYKPAERLKRIVAPWGVRCTVVDAAAVNKPKEIPDEAKGTWTGLAFGRVNPERPSVGHAGFAVDGPVVLLGTPEDNPLIKYLADQGFLPYKPGRDVFPGRGRGMVGWQRDGVGHGQESITLIAYDPEGISEAVGTMYEALAGLEPLTEWRVAVASSITPATRAPGLKPAAKVAWEVILPDKAAAMKSEGQQAAILTKDGTLARVAQGKVVSTQKLAAAEIDGAAERLSAAEEAAMALATKHARPDRLLKMAASGGGRTAVAYWGGTLQIVRGETIEVEQQLDQDIAGLAWLGGELVVGLADGRVIGLATQ